MISKPLLDSHNSTGYIIDDRLVRELISIGLSFDMYMILSTLKNNEIELFESYDSVANISQLVYQKLHREDYINTDKDKFTKYSVHNTRLTSKGLSIFGESVESWIVEWRELWPKGVTSGQYPVRSDIPGLTKKMKGFIKKHRYGKDIIFSATKRYLQEKQMNNWAYIHISSNFIEKNSVSMLASYCENNDTSTTVENLYVEKA